MATAAIAQYLEFLRFTRSPYFLVVLFGVTGLILLNIEFGKLTNDSDSKHLVNSFYWYVLALPIAVLLVVLTNFTLKQKASKVVNKEREKTEGQLKFSLSLCISSAVLCLVFEGIDLIKNESNELFLFLYFACIYQFIVFMFYAPAKLDQDKFEEFSNHSQFALVTASYLVGATICMSFINLLDSDSCNVIESLIFDDCNK